MSVVRQERWPEWKPTRDGFVMDAEEWARKAESQLEASSARTLREALREVSERTAARTLGKDYVDVNQVAKLHRQDLRAGRRR